MICLGETMKTAARHDWFKVDLNGILLCFKVPISVNTLNTCYILIKWRRLAYNPHQLSESSGKEVSCLGDRIFTKQSVVEKITKRGCFVNAQVLYIPVIYETASGRNPAVTKQIRFVNDKKRNIPPTRFSPSFLVSIRNFAFHEHSRNSQSFVIFGQTLNRFASPQMRIFLCPSKDMF